MAATFGRSSYGVEIVTGDVPLSTARIAGASLLPLALLVGLWHTRRHPLLPFFALGLVTSCVHNVDNILRPVAYFTPAWVYTPHAFPMDLGVAFWLLAVLGSGLLAMRLSGVHWVVSAPLALIHGAMVGLGPEHYRAEQPGAFSADANASIIAEAIAGAVVAAALILRPFLVGDVWRQYGPLDEIGAGAGAEATGNAAELELAALVGAPQISAVDGGDSSGSAALTGLGEAGGTGGRSAGLDAGAAPLDQDRPLTAGVGGLGRRRSPRPGVVAAAS